MRILITGHTGLVGSNLLKELKKRGNVVMGLSLETGHDLGIPGLVEYEFKKFDPDMVYHLAAQAAEARGQVSPIDMTQRNIGIFVNVLTASINNKVPHFVYTSSVAVYGEAKVPYREDGPTIPKDVYGVNKLACEQILKILSKVYGFDYTIFRPHNIYGPGQNMGDITKNVVALFMRKLIEGETYKLFGNGDMRRAFSYVDDVVEVLADASDLPSFKNMTMNVGSGHDISIRELSDMIQEISGIRGNIQYLPARPQEITLFLADHSLQNDFVPYHETPIREGLEKTWEWVKKKKLPELLAQENEIYVPTNH